MGQLVALPTSQRVTKKQLAAHLGRSERWIELRAKEGMPVIEATDRLGRRMYPLQEVTDWLDAGRPKRKPRDRFTALEERVAALERKQKAS